MTDTFFSKYIIEDQYRWLENLGSAETQTWIENECKKSRKYLNSVQARTNANNIIDKYGYAEYHRLKKLGDYYFTYSYHNNQDNPELFYQLSLF